jgi:hypothetical protein
MEQRAPNRALRSTIRTRTASLSIRSRRRKRLMAATTAPCPAGADVSFDDPADVAAAPPADRKIKYYRNPMGCRTFRRRPRRTRWGWTTSPSTKGEDSDEGSVKLSPGKIQRYRRQSEAGYAMRVIRTTIRAPGTSSSTNDVSP